MICVAGGTCVPSADMSGAGVAAIAIDAVADADAPALSVAVSRTEYVPGTV
jgi:hypothetical protein